MGTNFLSKRGSVYYYFYFDTAGKRHKITTKAKTKGDALRFVEQFTEAQETASSTSLLSAFRDEYLVFAQGHHTKKTRKLYGSAFNELIRFTGDIPIGSLTPGLAAQFLAHKSTMVSAWTSNHYRIALCSAFGTAVSWGRIHQNVFEKTRAIKTPELVPDFFSHEEWELFLRVVKNPDRRDLYVVAIGTGLRLGELRNLRWQDVNLVAATVFVRNVPGEFITKGKRQRTVPLPSVVLETLQRRQSEAGCEWVFHYRNPIRQITEATESHRFKRYVKGTKKTAQGDEKPVNQRLHFHSMRHTYASWLVASGVSLYAVQQLLGHSSSKTTEVYAHLAPAQLTQEVRLLDRFLKSAGEKIAPIVLSEMGAQGF